MKEHYTITSPRQPVGTSQLNDMSKEGWELFSCLYNAYRDEYHYIFSRTIKKTAAKKEK
jgi:hypothetical protein